MIAGQVFLHRWLLRIGSKQQSERLLAIVLPLQSCLQQSDNPCLLALMPPLQSCLPPLQPVYTHLPTLLHLMMPGHLGAQLRRLIKFYLQLIPRMMKNSWRAKDPHCEEHQHLALLPYQTRQLQLPLLPLKQISLPLPQ